MKEKRGSQVQKNEERPPSPDEGREAAKSRQRKRGRQVQTKEERPPSHGEGVKEERPPSQDERIKTTKSSEIKEAAGSRWSSKKRTAQT
jgi:hypothetical protein